MQNAVVRIVMDCIFDRLPTRRKRQRAALRCGNGIFIQSIPRIPAHKGIMLLGCRIQKRFLSAFVISRIALVVLAIVQLIRDRIHAFLDICVQRDIPHARIFDGGDGIARKIRRQIPTEKAFRRIFRNSIVQNDARSERISRRIVGMIDHAVQLVLNLVNFGCPFRVIRLISERFGRDLRYAFAVQFGIVIPAAESKPVKFGNRQGKRLPERIFFRIRAFDFAAVGFESQGIFVCLVFCVQGNILPGHYPEFIFLRQFRIAAPILESISVFDRIFGRCNFRPFLLKDRLDLRSPVCFKRHSDVFDPILGRTSYQRAQCKDQKR